MNRREMLLKSGAAAAVALSGWPLGWQARADDTKKKKVLVFTRSQGFQHSVVKAGKNGEAPLVDRVMTGLGKKHNLDIVCTKDGRIFTPEGIKDFDGFLFETTMDLTKDGGDGQPPMPPGGKELLLKAVANGKAFVGCHCASDTFHSKNYTGGRKWANDAPENVDPYIKMVGGEFGGHGAQQKSTMRVIDPSFPATKGTEDFTINEEWYSLMNFNPDMHVLLVQSTKGMKGFDYERPDFPATWARMHGKGRVFYTSMGHREDVWESENFQNLLMGGLSWALGRIDADVSSNMNKVTPDANKLPNKKA